MTDPRTPDSRSARLIPPGLRALRRAADIWGLDRRDRAAFFKPLDADAADAIADGLIPPPDSEDIIIHLSHGLWVWKNLLLLHAESKTAGIWLTSRNTAFDNRRPVDVIAEDEDGIARVRAYLDSFTDGCISLEVERPDRPLF